MTICQLKLLKCRQIAYYVRCRRRGVEFHTFFITVLVGGNGELRDLGCICFTPGRKPSIMTGQEAGWLQTRSGGGQEKHLCLV